MTSIKDMNKKVGDVLMNGYVILKKSSKGVLGYNAYKKEWATWEFNPEGYTVLGRYFLDKDKAYDYFDKNY